jgi:penicillin-binding protein 2
MIEFEKNAESINTVYRIFYLIVFIFSVNIINIQIINHSKYYLMSEKNRVRNIPKIGPRGNIITLDGISVATNKPSYSIIYFPKENISENRMLELSKKLASISSSDYKSINELIKKSQSTLKPVKLIDNISSKSAMFFYEIKNIFPEIEIVEENRRYYPYSSLLSHIIGYTGRMDEEDVKYYLKKGYSLDSYVGKTGVEKKYEEYLKGKDGGLFMEVDNRGRIIRLLGFED